MRFNATINFGRTRPGTVPASIPLRTVTANQTSTTATYTYMIQPHGTRTLEFPLTSLTVTGPSPMPTIRCGCPDLDPGWTCFTTGTECRDVRVLRTEYLSLLSAEPGLTLRTSAAPTSDALVPAAVACAAVTGSAVAPRGLDEVRLGQAVATTASSPVPEIKLGGTDQTVVILVAVCVLLGALCIAFLGLAISLGRRARRARRQVIA